MVNLFLALPLLALATALPAVKRASGVVIVSNRRAGKCLGTTFIRGARPGIGVDLVDCGSSAQLLWDIERGPGYVRVTNNDLVLDAGNNPGNFGSVGTETPVPGRGSQNWYYTDDNRIAITGGNQCLDDDGTRLQTYQCTTGNTNQIFYAVQYQEPDPQPPAGPNPYPDIPQGTVYPDQAGDRRRLHPFNRPDLCATVIGGFAAGSAVSIAYCVADSDPSAKFQIFNLQGTFSRIAVPIVLADSPGFCLTSSTANGTPATIQPCGSTPTKWQWSNSEQVFLLNGQRTCLDVQRESQPGNGYLRKVQTWECGDGNVQQKWTFLF